MSSTLGRYELLSRLGRGGMADVYLARRRGMGGIEKRLAIKRIRRERARDPRLLEMFVHEARLSMSMAHKNIVPMFDFGRVGDELFLVMEFIDGSDLGEALDRARRASHLLSPPVAAYVAMEACQALDYASRMIDEEGAARAIIHRDVTPRNVLLSYAGEVKLVDFGVATTETELGQAKKVRGTPSYMAPEQARGEQVDVRADLFSVGLILWECLTGRRARNSTGTVAQLLKAAREAHLEPLDDDTPEQLATIVTKATARDPGDRYESARAMQLALDEYLVAARAVQVGRAPPSHQLSEWLREVCPPGRDNGDASLPGELVGSVVTFLDDGGSIIRGATAAPTHDAGAKSGVTSEATIRSMAMTLAEAADDDDDQRTAANTQPGVDASEAPAVTGSRPLARGLLAVGAAVAAAAAIYVVAGGGSTRNDGKRDGPRAAVIPSIVDAPPAPIADPVAAPVDAAPVTPDPPATVDAQPATHPPTHVVAKDVRHTRPRPRPRPVKTTPPDAGVTGPPGTIRISSSPWATVRVVGSKARCAETPCRLALPPGRYKIRLSNPVARVGKTITVNVVSGETVDVVENLTRGQ